MADWLMTDSNLYVATGAILACGAMLIAWRTQKEILFRLTLAVACALGLIALILIGTHSGQRPFTAPVMALAALGTTIGVWGLIHGPRSRSSQLLHALAVALGLGAFLLSPNITWRGTHRWGTLFGLAEIGYVLASAALWHGLIATTAFRLDDWEVPTRSSLGAALLLLTLSLLLYGLGAQWAWGAYWSWEPFACWLLATWLVVALALSLFEHPSWASRRAVCVLWVAAGFSLWVLLGSSALIQWLGLNSKY